jgi:polysaccharide transporter, PST family
MTIPIGINRLFRSQLVHNIGALYGVHLARYLLPLAVVPYLARVLTPLGWGKVAFAQGFAAYLTLVTEYGFNLSATREVARYRGQRDKVGEILAGVTGAKLVLAALCCVLALFLSRWVPLFRDDAALLWTATFAAITQAFSPLWLFQGLERMKMFALLDVVGKLIAASGVFLFVHTLHDGWRVLALQGAGSFVAAAGGLFTIYHWFPAVTPTRKSVRESLRMGWTMFLFRSSVSFYTVGNSFILGLFAAPEFVGYYAGAERVCRAFVAVFDPISQALFPRMSYLVQHSRDKAQRLAHRALWLMGTGGLLLSICLFSVAPMVVRIFLGSSYVPAVSTLRILSLLPLLIALSNVLGIQWMIPLGMDRAFNAIILSAGALNLTLATVLARRYAQTGMASAVVAAEILVTLAMYLWLKKTGVTLLSARAKQEAEPDNVSLVVQ